MGFPNRSLPVLLLLSGCLLRVAPGCAGIEPSAERETSSQHGRFDLNLVVNGEHVDQVTMTLSSSALPAKIVRVIDTTHVTGSINAFAGLLPVGAYDVDFSGNTREGKSCSGHGGPVTVVRST
jgi:hypothetical protein